MKIYTKRGDTGDTSLYGGDRVSKSSSRIEAYGTVDELNTVVGLAASYPLSDKGAEWTLWLQDKLLVLGADLATPSSAKARIERIREDDITALEKGIDELEEELEPLRHFIHPGGSQGGATLHMARTVCRRAERAAVACNKEEELSALTIKFLNRLSDFFFVLARYENKQAGIPENVWKPERKKRK